MTKAIPANEDGDAPIMQNTTFSKSELQGWTKGLDTDRSDMLRKASIGLLLVFGFGGVWSCTVPLGGAVTAGGRVVAENMNRPIQHLEGGILKKVHVEEGQSIKAGDVLLELDTTRLAAALEGQRLKKAIARLELARYRADVNGDKAVVFPADLDAAIATSASILEAIDSQREAFKTGLLDRLATAENIDTKILGLKSDIEGHGKVLVALDRQLELFQLELKDFNTLLEQGHIQRTRVFATERKVVELIATIERRKLEMDKAENGIRIFETEKKQRQFQFLAESNLRLVATQKQYNEAHSAVIQYMDNVARATVRSPVTGTVFQLAKRTVGEVIKPGDTVIVLFPEEDALTIEANLQATDRDVVYLGQDVQVIFPSDTENQGVPVAGTLTYISADTLRRENDPTGSYIVRVKVEPEASPEQLLPGNIAEVYIQTEPETFAAMISKPFLRFAFKAFKG